MSKVSEAKEALSKALKEYHEIAHTANALDLRSQSNVVEAAQRQLSDAITEGAMPCPICKVLPHGMEHPLSRGRVEYEIGCLGCKPQKQDDGSSREPRVRGGMLPKHAVEAWNEGPEAWMIARS